MLSDGREVEGGAALETDVCIIGAGAAGITLARELTRGSARVLMLESGGEVPDTEIQSLYRGDNVGLPYFPLDACRLRYFGGSTNHWTGYSRPLDALDFAERSWVPDSGWPFGRQTLSDYYTRAHRILDLGPHGFEADPWAGISGTTPWPLEEGGFESELFQLSSPTRFGETYGPELRRADDLSVLLHSNVTQIQLDDDGGRVAGLVVKTLAGKQFSVRAGFYVLATGGIENARLLLASRSAANPMGLGNAHDRVGRYFMEHPHVSVATFLPSKPLDDGFYQHQVTPEGRYWGTLALRDSVLERSQLCGLSAALVSHPRLSAEYLEAAHSPARASLDELVRGWQAGELPDEFGGHVWRVIRGLDDVMTSYSASAAEPLDAGAMYLIWLRTEQAPNPNSRVTLADERDALGVPRVILDWQLSELDYRTIAQGHELLARALGAAGLGRMFLPGGTTDRNWALDVTGGNHHMGTTRMHADSRLGVVDADCRVHGVRNLYLAGSSVFPTAGYANPTLTIVALSLRLADELRRRLS